jgi:transposase
MFGLDNRAKVFLYAKPCDMRKGFNGLSGLVMQAMEMDPACGHLFVFINKTRSLAKILYWDADGLALYYKRLEEGTFKRPTARVGVPNSELTQAELYMILRGIDFEKTKKRKRFYPH